MSDNHSKHELEGRSVGIETHGDDDRLPTTNQPVAKPGSLFSHHHIVPPPVWHLGLAILRRDTASIKAIILDKTKTYHTDDNATLIRTAHDNELLISQPIKLAIKMAYQNFDEKSLKVIATLLEHSEELSQFLKDNGIAGEIPANVQDFTKGLNQDDPLNLEFSSNKLLLLSFLDGWANAGGQSDETVLRR